MWNIKKSRLNQNLRQKFVELFSTKNVNKFKNLMKKVINFFKVLQRYMKFIWKLFI